MMFHHPPSRIRAILLALLVTFLWSTSWILIKIGLKDVPALTFAGLRYMLAFLILIPFSIQHAHRKAIREMKPSIWGKLVLLGILLYGVAQGAQYIGLDRLPSTSVSLLLNLTSPVVALLGIQLLKENLSRRQWLGVLFNLAGVLVFFGPVQFPASQIWGMVIVVIGMLANSLGAILSRGINRTRQVSPTLVTTICMGIGAVLMLGGGIITEGIPRMTIPVWGIIVWLALVNTAMAFTLWNYTQQTLTAMESTIINSTMLIQIAILSWIFLQESLSGMEILGMILAAAGAVLVQLRNHASNNQA